MSFGIRDDSQARALIQQVGIQKLDIAVGKVNILVCRVKKFGFAGEVFIISQSDMVVGQQALNRQYVPVPSQ